MGGGKKDVSAWELCGRYVSMHLRMSTNCVSEENSPGQCLAPLLQILDGGSMNRTVTHTRNVEIVRWGTRPDKKITGI